MPSVRGVAFGPRAYARFREPASDRAFVTEHPAAITCGSGLEEETTAQIEPPWRKGLDFFRRGHRLVHASHSRPLKLAMDQQLAMKLTMEGGTPQPILDPVPRVIMLYKQ